MKRMKLVDQHLDATRRMVFGRCLRAVRVADGMVQLGVANRMGVTRSMLALYETGRHWPSAPILLGTVYGRRATALYARFVSEIPLGEVGSATDCDRVLARLMASAPVCS